MVPPHSTSWAGAGSTLGQGQDRSAGLFSPSPQAWPSPGAWPLGEGEMEDPWKMGKINENAKEITGHKVRRSEPLPRGECCVNSAANSGKTPYPLGWGPLCPMLLTAGWSGAGGLAGTPKF